CIDGSSLPSTAKSDLESVKADLEEQNYVPVSLECEVSFSEDCSLKTQETADRIRDFIQAGKYLGVNRVTVSITHIENTDKVKPALQACKERAQREGISLHIQHD
ncbi:MAG: hypothetical protein ABEI86_03250, partial [Halobacteriaceae archaeon]